MDLQVEKLDTHEARIIINIPDEVVARARRDVARKLSKQLRIPGFRPGMAPINVVVGTVGQQAFANELADELGSKYYAQAIDEAKVDPYGPGQLEDVKDSPTRLVVRVPLEPTVDLKTYKDIRVAYTTPSVTPDEVEAQLQYIREENAVVELVDRPAQVGDLVEADVEVTADGKEAMHNHRAIVLDDEHLGMPDLVQAIVGMKAGEHKETTVTLPDTIENAELRGKTGQALIDVRRVSSRALPDINDELAQAAGPYTTLAELRESLTKQLTDYVTRSAEQQYETSVLDAFTNLSTVLYPPQFVEDRLNDLVTEFKEDVSRDQHMPFDEWLKVQHKTEQNVRDELRPNAEIRAKKGLVMREFAREQNLEVSDEEIAAEVERASRRYGGENNQDVRRMLMRDESRRAMQNSILSEKVLRRMAQIARGETPEQAAEAVSAPTSTEASGLASTDKQAAEPNASEAGSTAATPPASAETGQAGQ